MTKLNVVKQSQAERGKLPTLSEVLTRKTRPPLDLYCFYIFLQQEGNEDVLDFWLDVQQHENLCRAYFKDLRKANVPIREDWPEFHAYARQNGSIFSGVAGLHQEIDYPDEEGGGGGLAGEKHEYGHGLNRSMGDFAPDKMESGYGFYGEGGHGQGQGHGQERGENADVFLDASEGRERRDTESHAGLVPARPGSANGTNSRPGTPTFIPHPPHAGPSGARPSSTGTSPRTPAFSGQHDFPNPQDTPRQASNLNSHQTSPSRPSNQADRGASNRASSRASFAGSLFGKGGIGLNAASLMSKGEKRRTNSSKAPTVIPRNQAITKEDLVGSGERIYARYLLPGAEKEIYLPPAIRIHEYPTIDPSNPQADPRVPDYFHSQKNWIFKSLETDSFVRFLRGKAFSNLTRLSMFLSLVAGLFSLWAGWVVGFTLIFLDYKPRTTRLYLIIPFFFAFYYLFSAYYSLSPILVLFNRSETRPFKYIEIRELYVKKMLRGRALWVTMLTVVATAIIEVIWYFPPGHRL